MRARSGMSLLETVVAMSMLLGFLIITHMTLNQGVRFVKETDSYAYPQKEGSVVLRKLRDELSNSHVQWIITGVNNSSVRFLSANDPEPGVSKFEFDPTNGDPLWKKWVCYFWDPVARTVTRYEEPLTAYFGPAPPGVSDLTNEPLPNDLPDSFPGLAGLRKHVVGRDIVDFQILNSGNGRWLIDLTAEKVVPVTTKKTTREVVRVLYEATAVILNS